MRRLVSAISGAAMIAAFAGDLQAQTPREVNIAAATFQPIANSTHNAFPSPVCGDVASSNPGFESQGVFFNPQGSFLAPLQIPEGSTITGLRYFTRDSDLEEDTHLYLARKRTRASANFLVGYSVLAEAHSTGAADRVRRFDDLTVNNPVFDNTEFTYWLEIVNCFLTIEPISAQVLFTTP